MLTTGGSRLIAIQLLAREEQRLGNRRARAELFVLGCTRTANSGRHRHHGCLLRYSLALPPPRFPLHLRRTGARVHRSAKKTLVRPGQPPNPSSHRADLQEI